MEVGLNLGLPDVKVHVLCHLIVLPSIFKGQSYIYL